MIRSAVLIVLAFGAGFFCWRWLSSPPVARHASSGTEPGPAPSEPRGRLRDETEPDDGTGELGALRKRLALFRSIPLREWILHGKEPPHARIRRAAGLPEPERTFVLQQWIRTAVYDKTSSAELLQAIRTETDPATLATLADLIDLGCTMKMTSQPTFTAEEKVALLPLVREADLPERRMAAIHAAAGDRHDKMPDVISAALLDVLRTEEHPGVLEAAAREFEQRFSPDALGPLLDAFRRMPAGEQRHMVARAYAKAASWQQVRARMDEAGDTQTFESWMRASVLWLSFKRGWRDDLPALYPRIQTRDVRRDLFYQVAMRSPDDRATLQMLERLEPLDELRLRYGRVLRPAAGTTPDPHALLYR